MANYGSTTTACMKRELVVVVGFNDDYKHGPNKMMFMAHAVRFIRLYRSRFDLATALYFPGKAAMDDGRPVQVHSPTQRAAFEKAVRKHGGQARAVSTWGEVASHINTKTVGGCQKRVQVLTFVAHGGFTNYQAYEGRVLTQGKRLGIWLDPPSKIHFNEACIKDVDAGSFIPANDKRARFSFRHVTSWACQTANAGMKDTAENNMRHSLAQKMANHWNINVFASVTRTEYTTTWQSVLDDPAVLENPDRKPGTADDVLWDEDGAYSPVQSGTSSWQSDQKLGRMPSGMFLLKPGQTSGYDVVPHTPAL